MSNEQSIEGREINFQFFRAKTQRIAGFAKPQLVIPPIFTTIFYANSIF